MIGSLEHHITDHCNLNCAGCSHFSPLAPPWIETLEEFKEEWDRVRAKNLKIQRVRILGGEPLLNPNLVEMVKYARNLFQGSDVNVVTNGILLASQKATLLPVFQEFQISITISRYPGLNLNYNDLLAGFPRIETYNKAGFWNISLHTEPDFNCDSSFYNCFSGQCNYLKGGRIYPCPIIANIPFLINYFPELDETSLGKIDLTKGGITIEDHSIEEIEAFLHKSNPICSFCNSIRAKEGHPWKRTDYQIKEWME